MAGNNLYMAMCGDEYGSNITNSGYKAVTTAGTRVQITATSTPCAGVLIQALAGNTSDITVGMVNVVGAAGATHIGVNLIKGDSIYMPIRDLNLLYLDSITNGDAAYYAAIQ